MRKKDNTPASPFEGIGAGKVRAIYFVPKGDQEIVPGVELTYTKKIQIAPPEWLEEYPEVIERDGKIYLMNTREWVKQTHMEVKDRYQQAVNKDDEAEANRLMEGLQWLNRYHRAIPGKPTKAKRKPMMWYVARWSIWADIRFLGGIKPYHGGAMLALAEKYGVDYYGNVYQSGW